MGLLIETGAELSRRLLAERIVALQYERIPNLAAKYGPGGRAKCVDDVLFNLLYLEAAAATSSPAIFLEYVRWVKCLFVRLNIHVADLRGSLEATRDIHLREQGAHCAALPILAAALEALDGMPEAPTDPMLECGEYLDLARCFLDTLLSGDRRGATRLIMDAAERVPLAEIYLSVFQPCLREVGRLWQINRVSVAQEHFFTAAAQMIMSQLYPMVFDRPDNGFRMVATCVQGELHEVGMRMVADLFEMDGWATTYLGASAPLASVVGMISERRPHILAISATIGANVPRVGALIEAIRQQPGLDEVKVLVGGYPFLHSPDLWRRVGADGFALDGRSALQVAREMVS